MKTIIYREGDTGTALCEHCEDQVSTHYDRRDVPLSDGSDVVKGVLVGVCDVCDSVVLMPPQSTPRVNRVVQKQKNPIEARVPSHFKDMFFMVNSALHQVDGFEQTVVRYYVRRWSDRGVPATRVRRYCHSDLFRGHANSRLSFKIRDGDAVLKDIRNSNDSINTNTDLIKAIAMAAYEDIVESPKSQAKSALKTIAEACA